MATAVIDHQPIVVGIGGEPIESPVQTLMMRRLSLSSGVAGSSALANGNRRTSTAGSTMMTALAAAKAEVTGDTDHSSESGLDPPDVDLRRVPTYLQPSLPWRKRLLHFTFAWYTVT